MDRFVNNLRVLWRTERAIAEIKMRHVIARSGLNLAAGMLALIGLLMFEVAAFFALREVVSTVDAALILGAANFVLAGILAPDRRPQEARPRARACERDPRSHHAGAADRRAAASGRYRLVRAGAAASAGRRAASLIVPLATMLMGFLKKKDEPK